jgi:hypothetical protein
MYAAQNYGCRITTTTISQQQYEMAKERIEKAGLSDQITLLLKDYRDLEGKYDKAVSIEMIEAVGHHYFDTFFRCCSERLKEDGMMLLQAITITDRLFERHKREVDFIKRYIFPGSCIPSIAVMAQANGSPISRFFILKISRPIMHGRCAHGDSASLKTLRKCASLASETTLYGCGNSTSVTARGPLWSGIWVMCRCS